MTEHDTTTFSRHPSYDPPGAPSPSGPEYPAVTSGPGVTARSGRGRLLGWIGAAVAIVSVALSYVVVRWVDDPGTWFVVLHALALVVLAVLALLAGRRGALAPFVAIALLLPFSTVLSVGAAASERVEEALDGWFSSSDDGDSDGDGDGFSFSFGDDDAQGSQEAKPKNVALGDEASTGSFDVTVDGYKCTDTLPEAKDNPDYFTSDDAAQYLDAKAPKGKQFCIVSSTWKNSSKEPASASGWDSFSALVTDDGTKFAADGDDTSYSFRLTEQAGHDNGELNPGDSAEVRTVFTVARDLEFTHAVVDPFGFDVPEVWFDLR